MVEKPVWNNAKRVNHQNSQRISHPHPKGNFVPKAVLMKSGLKTLNTARQNSSKAAVYVFTGQNQLYAYYNQQLMARPASNVFNRGKFQYDFTYSDDEKSGILIYKKRKSSHLLSFIGALKFFILFDMERPDDDLRRWDIPILAVLLFISFLLDNQGLPWHLR
ncbi:hypothetical protein Tco_0246318 [Tanacetum coccineum]